MNKVNILSIVFAGICAFSACTDDKDPVINDLKDSEGNNISFTLNAPNNSSYTLMPENASSIIDIFTCEQPDYGFAAGVTYTVQVCEGGTEFEKFESLPTTGSGEKVLIKTFELNDAMNNLGMVNPTVAYNVDFRLKAFINDSVPELYSNTVNMAITPYSGARTQVYFVGDIFDNGWNNNDPSMRMGVDRSTFRDAAGEINPNSDVSFPGYGVTMNEVASYIGCLQVGQLDELLEKQRQNAFDWQVVLPDKMPGLCFLDTENINPNYWVFGILAKDKAATFERF